MLAPLARQSLLEGCRVLLLAKRVFRFAPILSEFSDFSSRLFVFRDNKLIAGRGVPSNPRIETGVAAPQF